MPSLFSPTPSGDASRILASCRGRVSRLSVANHPALRIRPGLEGYRDYVFGARAGPSLDAVHLFHELAHAAEFGPDLFRHRGFEFGFKFKVPQRFVYDRYCVDPKTKGATDRELRTFALQLHLMRLAGYKRSEDSFFQYSAKVMRFMHDWYMVPGKTDEARAAHCAKAIERHYQKFSPAEAVDRLEGWLDATARRWHRQKKRPEDFGGYPVFA